MKPTTIVFATSQGNSGSTNIGRVFPLAEQFRALGHECVVLALGNGTAAEKNVRYVGRQPFRRTGTGKVRRRGLRLISNILATALRTAWALWRLKPDVVIISKPLPANVLGVRLFKSIYNRQPKTYKLVLDADDFELTANKLTSIYQRAAIHWSERVAAKLASSIVVASPFLSDHFRQLTQDKKPIVIIPTGINGVAGPVAPAPPPEGHPQVIYIGSISASSGHRVDLLPPILAEVHKRIPQAQLLIAGDGDDVTALKEEFTRRGLTQNVTWAGRFTLSGVEELLAHSAVIVDPIDDSIANRAKSSFRVMLAGIFGRPIVTSNIGIRPELIPTEFHQRFFAQPGDAATYGEKIAAALSEPLTADEARRLAQHASAYTWDKLARRYNEILKP